MSSQAHSTTQPGTLELPTHLLDVEVTIKATPKTKGGSVTLKTSTDNGTALYIDTEGEVLWTPDEFAALEGLARSVIAIGTEA